MNLHQYPFELKLNQHKEHGQCHDHIQRNDVVTNSSELQLKKKMGLK